MANIPKGMIVISAHSDRAKSMVTETGLMRLSTTSCTREQLLQQVLAVLPRLITHPGGEFVYRVIASGDGVKGGDAVVFGGGVLGRLLQHGLQSPVGFDAVAVIAGEMSKQYLEECIYDSRVLVPETELAELRKFAAPLRAYQEAARAHEQAVNQHSVAYQKYGEAQQIYNDARARTQSHG